MKTLFAVSCAVIAAPGPGSVADAGVGRRLPRPHTSDQRFPEAGRPLEALGQARPRPSWLPPPRPLSQATLHRATLHGPDLHHRGARHRGSAPGMGPRLLLVDRLLLGVGAGPLEVRNAARPITTVVAPRVKGEVWRGARKRAPLQAYRRGLEGGAERAPLQAYKRGFASNSVVRTEASARSGSRRDP